jgi:hypothetical protein
MIPGTYLLLAQISFAILYRLLFDFFVYEILVI